MPEVDGQTDADTKKRVFSSLVNHLSTPYVYDTGHALDISQFQR